MRCSQGHVSTARPNGVDDESIACVSVVRSMLGPVTVDTFELLGARRCSRGAMRSSYCAGLEMTPSCIIMPNVSIRIRVDMIFSPANRSITMPHT